ncbi:hypothetical protein BO86DRAFT_376996 [Aspergillus japonicus CBS 114.51]|uniref:TPR-like protein n=1 Tax=Aspergillus japonicus CBS 114.51 TaxID=1448312 RepID=A0A8T8XA08_ASPJA|nr:hypothetical protein BO86DRAFT_376996 [Aspergillus japonicus CBS 114.51]RAH84820.1 hypothetical protein BO86DRAFT_376996 [Aspergillus japonicus CBS 114.51]
MSQADTPLVVQKYPVLHQVYEALGLATLYTHHAGDFRAALQIVEAECSICDAKDEARLAAALTGRGIVRTLQGNCVGALADLRAATTMEHSDLPLKLLACLYWYQATQTQYALFPDNGPAGAKEIQYRFDAVQTLQDWQAQTSPLSEAYSTDPPLRVVDQALRLYRSLTSFPRANPGADSTFRTAQDTLLSGIDTDYDTLAIWRPDPRMLGHMRLLRARTALRIHGREEAMQDLAIAEQLAREVDDSVGLADVELTRGDFLAAPLSSPGVWNSLLAESTYDTCLHWQADEAEWDVDTERIGEAKARYDAALTRFAAANARRGIAAVKMRLGCLEVLEGMRRVVFEPSFAAAKTDIERAVAISSELGDMMAVQLGRAQLALCAIGQGDQSEQTQQVGVSLGTWGRREGSFGFTLGVGLFFARIGWRWINHLGDYERALACFRLAETLFQALQASLSRVHSIVDQLKVYQMVGDFPSCTRTLERALDECLEVQKREPGLVAEVSRLARWISIEMLGLATKRAVPHLIERVRAYIKNIRKTHESADPAGLSAGLDIFQELLNRLQAGEDLADSSSEPSVGHALYQQDATQMTDLFLESQLADSEIYQDLYSGKEAKKNGHPAEAHVCFDRVRVVAESMSGYRRHYFNALADAYEGEYQRAAPAYTQYVDGELEEMDRMARLGFPPSLDDDRRRQAASRALSFFCEIGHFEEAHKWLHLLSQNWPDWWKKDGQSWLSLGRIAQVEEGLGHFEAALLQYEEGIRMFEAQRQRLSIDELKIAFAADSPTSALFVGCIRTLLKLQDQPNIKASRRRELQAKIFDVAERNKARSLMDLMEGGLVGRLSSSESGPLPRWRRLNAKRTSRCGLLEQALHSSDPERPRIAALQAEITAIEQQIAAVENDMAATGSPLRTWAAELSTLDAVCETLPVGVPVFMGYILSGSYGASSQIIGNILA